MAKEGLGQELFTIFSAGVQVHSRVMGKDEDATIRTPTTYQRPFS